VSEERPLHELIAEIRAADPPPPKPIEWEFVPTAEGILCVCEGGHFRGATVVEQYFYERYRPESEDEPPLRTAERAIVRALMDSGLGPAGQQSQVTHADRFEIATDDVVIRVELNRQTS
jgi:hypothetical protein